MARKRKKKFIQKAIKRPGKLTAEAKASGRSKLQQAEHDAHSSDPSTRGRGILGERLLKGDIHRANKRGHRRRHRRSSGRR